MVLLRRPGQIALFYFAPVIASIIGEVWGHFVNDFLANQYIKRHHGTFEPEVRLVAYLIGFPFLVAGLSSLGYVLENHWHWALAAVTWGLYVFGIMVASTGLTTYVVSLGLCGTGSPRADRERLGSSTPTPALQERSRHG